jgi:hypothetical protein
MRQYLYEIEYQDEQYQTHSAQLQTAEQRLRGSATLLRQAQEKAETLPIEADLMAYIVELANTINAREALGESVFLRSCLAGAQNFQYQSALLTNEIAGHQSSKTACEQQLAQVRETFSRYPDGYNGVKRVTKDLLQHAFQHVHGIRPGSIALFRQGTHEVVIRWVFTDLWAKTSPPPYRWINNSQPLDIKIPDVEVLVHLMTRAIVITFADDPPPATGFAYNGSDKPHPHLMGGDNPCMGDFGPLFNESLHDEDYETMATVLRLFLETINLGDVAGGYGIAGLRLENLPDFRFIKAYLSHSGPPDALNKAIPGDFTNPVRIVPTDTKGLYRAERPPVDPTP